MDEAFDVGKLRRGDPEEFARLVAAHQRVVLGLCQSQGLSAADSADTAAEVFCMVYRGLPGFRGESQLGTWIYRIAHRAIVRARAGQRRHDALPPDLPDGAGTPAAACAAREQNALIWRAVAQLEPAQATVVELYYRQGWGVEAIAAVLEKPTGSVKTLLHRARQRLRQVLAHAEVADG